MRDLVKASFVTWVGSIAIALAALARGKVFAVWLGPAGVGIVSQLLGFINLVGLIGSFSLGSGIAKHIAEFVGQSAKDDVRRVVQTSLVLAFLLGVLLTVVAWLAAPHASRWLFDGDEAYAHHIRLLSLAIVALSLIPNLQSILNGYGAATVSAGTNIIVAVATIPLGLILVRQWGIEGAIIFLILIPIIRLGSQVMGMLWKYGHALHGIPRFIDERAVRRILSPLIRIAIASVIMKVSDSAALLFVRTQVIRLYGTETNGLYQAAFGAASQVLTVSMAFLGTYAFSSVSSATTSLERTERTNEAFHLSVLVAVLGVSGLILFRGIFVTLLLSPQFIPAESLFALQATGEAFKHLGLAVGLGILLTASVRTWMIVHLTWGVCSPVFALIFLRMGYWALPMPYFLTGLVYFMASWLVMVRSDDFKMSARNKWNLLSGAIVISFLALLPLDWMSTALGIVIVAVWCWFALGHYRQSLWALLRGNFSRWVERVA